MKLSLMCTSFTILNDASRISLLLLFLLLFLLLLLLLLLLLSLLLLLFVYLFMNLLLLFNTFSLFFSIYLGSN